MEKKIKVSLMFEFDLDTYQDELDAGMSFEEIVRSCMQVAAEDIEDAARHGEIYDSLKVEIVEGEN